MSIEELVYAKLINEGYRVERENPDCLVGIGLNDLDALRLGVEFSRRWTGIDALPSESKPTPAYFAGFQLFSSKDIEPGKVVLLVTQRVGDEEYMFPYKTACSLITKSIRKGSGQIEK